MPTRLMMGPILYHRESTSERWEFAVMALIRATSLGEATQCVLEITDDSAPGAGPIKVPKKATLHADFFDVGLNYCWVGWNVAVPRADDERIIAYRVTTDADALEVDDVAIPKRGILPRIAFFSCNGAGE